MIRIGKSSNTFSNGKSIGKQDMNGSDTLRIGVADIGNWSSLNAGEHHFEGVIDELMVLSIRLDADQLAGIAAAGRPALTVAMQRKERSSGRGRRL